MRVPRITGFGKQRRPPVEEKTSSLPVKQSPLGKRSTAGVCSVVLTRGAREASDEDGLGMLNGKYGAFPSPGRDYEREWMGKVTPVSSLLAY
jgi:hypothetical protein